MLWVRIPLALKKIKMHLISLFIPLITSLYIGFFGRFLGKTGGFLLALIGIILS
jgi:hypothetical protein